MLINKRGLIFSSIVISILLAGFVIYGIWIEPYRIEIHHIWIHDSKLGTILKNRIIVQLSDLHINKIGKREYNVLRILDDIKPDIIFLTGDYVKWRGDYEEALIFLSRLKANIGIWGVLGDYDYSRSRRSCLFCHEPETGKFTQVHQVHFLRNSQELINLPEGAIRVEGIDIEGNEFSPSETGLLVSRIKGPAIMLSHRPISFDDLDENEDIFLLAGDTHGGQIPLPSLVWKIVGYKKNALYSQGLFREGA